MKKSLPNPCDESSDDARLNINTDATIFRDLFHRLFAGEHGIKAAIVNTLLVALHSECKEQKLPFQCEPENITTFKTILKNVNFKPSNVPATVGCGRPANGTPLSVNESPSSLHDGGGIDDTGGAPEKPRNQCTSTGSRVVKGSKKNQNSKNKKALPTR